jgi:hypothetical protein
MASLRGSLPCGAGASALHLHQAARPCLLLDRMEACHSGSPAAVVGIAAAALATVRRSRAFERVCLGASIAFGMRVFQHKMHTCGYVIYSSAENLGEDAEERKT